MFIFSFGISENLKQVCGFFSKISGPPHKMQIFIGIYFTLLTQCSAVH